MRVTQVNEPSQREACLARLCADTYGNQSGLTPLLRFAGVLGVLFEQQAARVLALVDDSSQPLALALLVIDKAGQGMTPMLLADIDTRASSSPAMRLINELAEHAPLRVDAPTPAAEERFRRAGITRWFDAPQGLRVGLSAKHPAGELIDVSPALGVDDAAVAQSFKHDHTVFEDYKQRFVDGLANVPATL
ncbi:MAG: hypothetical protein L0I84_08165 [Halomonas subglaciescola]|nr:hypothetical protein [Halomonas subglaciescola]